MAAAKTLEIPIFPLNVVLFPHTRLPLRIFEDRYKKLFEDSLKDGAKFGIALIREGLEVGGPATPFDVGTLAEIEAVDHHKDSMFLLVKGTNRFKILSLKHDKPYLVAKVEILDEVEKLGATEKKAADALEKTFTKYVKHLKALAAGLGGELKVPEPKKDASAIERVFGIAFTLPLEPERKQILLETHDVGEFILRLDTLLSAETGFLEPDANDPSIA